MTGKELMAISIHKAIMYNRKAHKHFPTRDVPRKQSAPFSLEEWRQRAINFYSRFFK